MIQRGAIDRLVAWFHNQKTRKPLLIRGARQVGKTTLVRMVAQQLGVKLVEINLEKPWSFVGTFTALNPRRTVEAIEFELNLDIDPDQTILFFDEAQACPSVLPLLRYFYEEAPEYRVITTGSLLEFVLAQPSFSLPVGRIELFHLSPLTFQEFLGGIGESKALEAIEGFSWGDEISDTAHTKLNALVKTYCLVGGMPESVAVFREARSLRASDKTRSQIIETFRIDFNKYLGKADPSLLQVVFDSLPNLMGRKLVYAKISPEYRTRELSAAVRQLCLAGVAIRIHHSHANGIPLAAEKRERFFKLLLLDVGLLLSQQKLIPAELEKAAELNLVNKGTVAEQFVGQQLLSAQAPHRPPELFYWCREKPSSSAEVDYLLEAQGQVIPVEVKAGKAGKLRSLQVMVKEKGLLRAVRFFTGRPSLSKETRGTALGTVEYQLISLPHYLVQQTPRLLAENPSGK